MYCRLALSLLSAVWLSELVTTEAQYFFNYGDDDRLVEAVVEYSMEKWIEVECNDVNTCTGYPEKYPFAFNWTLGENNCKWCPLDSPDRNCGVHKQSPIDLSRKYARTNTSDAKQCPDWHSMTHQDESCEWKDMYNQFEIMRHTLRLNVPQLPDGEVGCIKDGVRRYPRTDFSKGFSAWWFLQGIEISVPSQHKQQDHRYAAEVLLLHFYEEPHYKNQQASVNLFLQDYPDATSWPYLDKLICAWRLKEEETRKACGLPPAPPYGRCQLFRNQQPTEAWLAEAGYATNTTNATSETADTAASNQTPSPTTSPVSVTSIGLNPTTDATSNPGSSSSSGLQGTGSNSDFNFGLGSGSGSGLGMNFGISKPNPSSSTSDSTETSSSNNNAITSPAQTVSGSVPSSVTAALVGTGASDRSTNSAAGVNATTATSVPATIDCSSFSISYSRMCASSDACCGSTRSDTDFCWDIYENIFPGSLINSACYHCCPDGPQVIGDPAPANPSFPKTVQCSSLDSQRMCRPGSCCDSERSSSQYCQGQYSSLGEQAREVCWYCCRNPIDIGPNQRKNRRGLRSVSNQTFIVEDHETVVDDMTKATKSNDDFEKSERTIQFRQFSRELLKETTTTTVEKATTSESHSSTRNKLLNLDADAIVAEDEPTGSFTNKRSLVADDNTAIVAQWDEDFDQRYQAYKEREIQYANTAVFAEDYTDVLFLPYEWMFKVGTEYYFRYEGTMLVPPCRETVHYRVMKDPIRVHSRQIAELNRLQAWRISPPGEAKQCEPDTAGILEGTDKVKLNRDLQYEDKNHRTVFCECQDWPSKMEGDQEWCKKWQLDTNFQHLDVPYNFPTNNQW